MTTEQQTQQPKPVDTAELKAAAAAAVVTEAVDKPTEKPADAVATTNEQEAAKPDDAPAASEKPDAETEEDKDESWYGKGPADSIVAVVKDNLGESVSDLFVKACRQYDGSVNTADTPNVTRLLQATSTFVKALKLVPENMQLSAAFGEMSLAYGKALVRYVEIEGTGSTAVTAKIVKTLQSALAAGRTEATDEGVDTEEAAEEKPVEEAKEGEKGEDGAENGKTEEKKENGATGANGEKKDEENGNAAEEEDEEDDDNEEELRNAWTQLEVARVIFSQNKMGEREGECRATLGELLMACDEGSQAGAEFATAIQLFTDARRQAECCYKQYLAVRNSDRSQGLKALSKGVEILSTVKGAEKELEEMKVELKEFEQTISEDDKTKTADIPTEVQVVRPKRKRDVANGGDKKEDACESAAKPAGGDQPAGEREEKKAKVDA